YRKNRWNLNLLMVFFILIIAFSSLAQKPAITVRGAVRDVNRDRPVLNFTVNLMKGNAILKRISPEESWFEFALEKNIEYRIIFEKRGYSAKEIIINTNLPDSVSGKRQYNFITYMFRDKYADQYNPDGKPVTISYKYDCNCFANDGKYPLLLKNAVGDFQSLIEQQRQLLNPFTDFAKMTKEFLGEEFSDSLWRSIFAATDSIVVEVDMEIPEIDNEINVPTVEMPEMPRRKTKDSIRIQIAKMKDSINAFTRNIMRQVRISVPSIREEEEIRVVNKVIVKKVDSIIKGSRRVIDSIEEAFEDPKKMLTNEKSLLKSKKDIMLARGLLQDRMQNAMTKEDSLMIRLSELQLNESEDRMLLAEKELENAKRQIALQKAEIKGQKLVIMFAGVFLLFLIVFLIIVLRQNKAKKRANVMLESQNLKITQQKNEIEAQRDEIEAQRDEITAQRDLVVAQKEQIEEIHEELTDSISYAERIQKAILPAGAFISEVVSEHFIMYRPRDVVSGDFYFVRKISRWLLAAVADCTGHGVPGGFMSMMGVAFLSEIVVKEHITGSAQVLEELRNKIITALHQSGNGRAEEDVERETCGSGQGSGKVSYITDVKDGMDIAFCAIDTGSMKCQFAGANNPLYFIQNVSHPADVKHLHEIKGDKMPIGIHTRMNAFTNHEFQLNRGDTLYMFTDGYIDQIGGERGKRFKSNQFRGLLTKVSSSPLHEQAEVLELTLDKWQGHINPKTGNTYEQIDDICVMGVRM
ncbi:MAG: SpoIIE family protein phosphatase, partial [Bacteroidetes bacterium]|nr:SpoIIE family protein phosphatase [Bacteroidota bacterium]